MCVNEIMGLLVYGWEMMLRMGGAVFVWQFSVCKAQCGWNHELYEWVAGYPVHCIWLALGHDVCIWVLGLGMMYHSKSECMKSRVLY
jgi:hypothetical protein